VSSDPRQRSNGPDEPEGGPQVEAKLDLDFLDEAARRRVEQVIQRAMEDELARQPLPQGTSRIIAGVIR